jgi:NADH:ubiquinone oxidoreductase subunit F (NADH-binding)
VLPAAALTGALTVHDAHLRHFGPMPAARPEELIAAVQGSGLTGRGGAGFPTYRKLIATAGRGAVVVGNGAEGEPLSGKDRALLSLLPHLVLDGLGAAARATGAREALLYVADAGLVDGLARTAADRHRRGIDELPVTVVRAAARFIDGEESAVAARLSGRPALPRSRPPAVYDKGVSGRPTLVQNVETLAHLALVARYGAAWFRTAGTPEDPGSRLVTIGGAVPAPGVVEVPSGALLSDVVARAGATAPMRALLVGGFHGAWVPGHVLSRVTLSRSSLAPYGAQPGAGVLGVLPAGGCGIVEAAAVLRYLAEQSAGQCGPCLNGLPAIATVMQRLAAVEQDAALPGRALELAGLVERRGACHHPDGTARFLRSTLGVFSDEVRIHLDGHCSATDRRPVLPVPGRGVRG